MSEHRFQGRNGPHPKETKETEERTELLNKPKLELVRGGLDTTIPPTGGNWLLELPVETIFLCRPKTVERGNFMFLSLQIINKTAKAVILWEPLSDKIFGYVDPTRFVNYFDFVETLNEPRQEQEEETDNG